MQPMDHHEPGDMSPDEREALAVLRRLQAAVHQTAVEKWGVDDSNLHRDLNLIHEEVSEAGRTDRLGLEAGRLYRSEAGKLEGLGAELADIIIRCMSVAGAHGVPLAEAVVLKMRQNTDTPRDADKRY